MVWKVAKAPKEAVGRLVHLAMPHHPKAVHLANAKVASPRLRLSILSVEI
jgi:hypothetical protein